MDIVDGVTFDDVLLIPNHSEITSRANIDTSVNLGKGIYLNAPFISANMKTVTGPKMAKKMARYGLGILHRFGTLQECISDYVLATSEDAEYYENYIGVSVGINSTDYIDSIMDGTDAKIICVDVAHGDHSGCIATAKYISNKYPNVLLIAGNVATGEGAKRLSDVGVDVVKTGIGSGALCTTRIETGNGVPQLTALESVYNVLGRDSSRVTKIISDGGIRNAGDIVKALCFSDAVMLGSLLSGTDEAPGEVVDFSGEYYKEYSGSSTHKNSRIEGVSGLVRCKGSADVILQKLKEGLQSGLSYQGCKNLVELRECPRFVRISLAGLTESRPHASLK